LAFFSKTNVMINFFSKFGFVLRQKRQFFRWIFRRKYFKNLNISPRMPDRRMELILCLPMYFASNWRNKKTQKLLASRYRRPTSRVARWFVFKTKIQMWVNFGGSCNRRWWYILWTLGPF
jgi:hypothetical protein